MKKAILAVSLVFLSFDVFPSPLAAQSTAPSSPRPISSCSSGLRGGGPDCAPSGRLLIVVRLNGAEAPVAMLEIAAMGTSSGGAFALNSRNATTADSALYGVIDLTRDSQGNYRIEQSTAGSMVKPGDDCRSVSTGRLDDMGFGAYLALATQKLVRCVQNERAAGKS
jgi:hypothetical protein